MPEPVDVVTVDVSYLSLAEAVRQLERLEIAPRADLIGLVKPMFELRLPTAPTDAASLREALETATAGVTAGGWRVEGSIDSPVAGSRGARELLIHARRPAATDGPRDL